MVYIKTFNEILSSVRDGHLNIRLTKIENQFNLVQSGFCSPFELYIETRNNVEIVKMKNYTSCIRLISKKDYILKYLDQHSNMALKSINGTYPFDFIQNFWRYQTLKNRHAQFTRNIDSIKSSGIHVIPFDHLDLLNIEYEFENGDIIKIDYVFFATSSFTDINQKEFEEFHHSLTFNQSNPFLIPNLLKAKQLFQKKKEFYFRKLQKELNGILKWKMSI